MGSTTIGGVQLYRREDEAYILHNNSYFYFLFLERLKEKQEMITAHKCIMQHAGAWAVFKQRKCVFNNDIYQIL